MALTLPRRRELIILAILMAIAFAMRMAFLHEPLERDEGWYATIAMEILHGGVPYRDAIDQKPPGIFYIYAGIIQLFGASVEAIRIFTAAYALLTLGSIYALTRYLANPATGLVAAAIFAFFSPAPLLQGSSSNCELFMSLPLVLSALFFVSGHDSNDRRLLLSSGLMAGCAMAIKTVALPYLLLLAAGSYFFSPGKRAIKRDSVNVIIFLLPSICLALVIIAYFQYRGALHDFLYWNITAPMIYSQGAAGFGGPALKSMVQGLSHELLPPFLLASTASVVLLLKKKDLNHVLVVLLFPVSWLAALLPGMNLPHYFVQTVPFMAILGAIGLTTLSTDRKAVFWLTLAIFLVLSGNYLRKDFKFFGTMSMADVSTVKFGPEFVNSVKIAEYIKQRTNPGDYIFQWGFEPELYFLTGRRSPTPFIASTILKMLPDREASVEQLLKRLVTTKPKFIIFQNEWSDCPGVVDIRLLLDRDYLPETVIGYGHIYRLKEKR